MPLPAGLPDLPSLPNLNLPTPHLMPGLGLPELGSSGTVPVSPPEEKAALRKAGSVVQFLSGKGESM